MAHAHLNALQRKHQALEKRIHEETAHAARDEIAIKRMKLEKLHIMEEIARFSENRA